MKRVTPSVLLVVLTLLQAGDTFAQRPGQTRRGGGGPGTPGSATLERTGLKVGQQMPDVTIYDENGEKFPLSRVKGKYAVLVFGCLT